MWNKRPSFYGLSSNPFSLPTVLNISTSLGPFLRLSSHIQANILKSAFSPNMYMYMSMYMSIYMYMYMCIYTHTLDPFTSTPKDIYLLQSGSLSLNHISIFQINILLCSISYNFFFMGIPWELFNAISSVQLENTLSQIQMTQSLNTKGQQKNGMN